MRLNELGEFGLLQRIQAQLSTTMPGVVVGSGDDAAVLSLGEGGYLLVSTDAVVEGQHFRQEWLSYEEIGERAARAALSDLAAMGGQPRGLLASVAVPADLEVEAAEALARGLEAGAAASGAQLIGGDMAASPGPIFVDVVVVGETPVYWPRAGAQPGNVVFVSGDLGRTAAALHLLQQGQTCPQLPVPLQERFLRPQPAFDLVEALQPLKVVTAAIDISDGLVSDLGHIAERSQVQIVVEADQVPVGEIVQQVAAGAGCQARDWALGSGEEYELAFTVPAEAVEAVHQAIAERGARPVTVIGKVLAGSGVVVEGGPPADTVGGYDHFGVSD